MEKSSKQIVISSKMLIVISTFFWGICAHGFNMFNKFTIHDDVLNLGFGSNYTHGRWMLPTLEKIFSFVFGSSNLNDPLFHTLFSFVCIALVCIMIAELLNIENYILLITMSGLAVVTPSLTVTYAYMFMIAPYSLGILLGVLGVYIFAKNQKWYRFIIGAVLIAVSMGIYQAIFAISVSVLLLSYINEIVKNDYSKEVMLKKAAIFLALGVASLLLYILANTIAVNVTGVGLSSYRSINTYSSTSLVGYLKRIILAYKRFLYPGKAKTENIFFGSARTLYLVSVVLVGILSLNLLIKLLKDGKKEKALFAFLAMCLIPMATNLIYVICDISDVYNIMLYAQNFTIFYLVWLLEITDFTGIKWHTWLQKTVIAMLLLMNVVLVRFDNGVYYLANYYQEANKSQFTTLVTKIKSVPGYDDEMPVAYIGSLGNNDATKYMFDEFSDYVIFPYWQFGVHDYRWKESMKLWCGFAPEEVDSTEFLELDEVKEMTNYPDDGSIKIINDTVVVKFAD